MRRVLNIHEVNDTRLDEVPLPSPGARDVVIDVRACGICGSDLTYIKVGGIMRQPGGVTPLGHEAAGEVSFVGADVSGVTVGQHVVINPMQTPAMIGSGGPEGAFTEQLLVTDARVGDNLLPIPDDLPFDMDDGEPMVRPSGILPDADADDIAADWARRPPPARPAMPAATARVAAPAARPPS